VEIAAESKTRMKFQQKKITKTAQFRIKNLQREEMRGKVVNR